MANSNAIGDVSATLQKVLHDALVALDPGFFVDVSDLQGTMSVSPAHLTIFLFEVVEDPSARNRPPVRQATPPDVVLKKPPVALILRYMLTPWSGDRITDHKIVGKVIETLYDKAILSGPDLLGTLLDSNVALKITLSPITLEDRTRVWYSVQKPYRLSLTYEVRVVDIDSTVVRKVAQVTSRTMVPAVPEGAP
jgi:hypothetical protein